MADNTQQIVKLGAMGFGAYLLWPYVKPFIFPADAAAATSSGSTNPAPGSTSAGPVTTPPASTPTDTPTTPPVTPAPTASNWTKFADALRAAGYTTSSLMSCDQWNYFYNQAVGPNAAPDPMSGSGGPLSDCVSLANTAPGQSRTNRGTNVPYDVWRGWMSNKGLGNMRRTGYTRRLGYTSAYGRNFGYAWR